MPFRVRAGARLVVLVLVWTTCFGTDEPKQISPRDEAWRVMRAGLRDSKAANRREAVKALSLISNNKTAQQLAERSLQDAHPTVRTAAAASLGQLHAKSAIPALKKALSDKELPVVLAATYSLFLLKDKSAYGIYYAILMRDKKSSEGMIQAQIDRLKDPKQVAELGVQEGLGFVPFGGVGFEAYRQFSKRNIDPVRAAAARYLAHDPNPISQDALIQSALADPSENVRQAALDALAERGDPACVERLLQNLNDSKDAIRYRTAAVIIHLTAVKKSTGKKPRAAN
jgi:HEAT repeat protein